jgi:hypothetical protein
MLVTEFFTAEDVSLSGGLIDHFHVVLDKGIEKWHVNIFDFGIPPAVAIFSISIREGICFMLRIHKRSLIRTKMTNIAGMF